MMLGETDLLLSMLALIDAALVASLIVMIIISGYEILSVSSREMTPSFHGPAELTSDRLGSRLLNNYCNLLDSSA